MDNKMSRQLLTQVPAPQRLLELFEQDCRDRQLSAETIRRYQSSVKNYLAYLERHRISLLKVDKHVLHEYIRERRSANVKQKTLENDLSALASIYDFLVFEDYVVKNPVPPVRKRYLPRYKQDGDVDAESPRKLLSIEQMSLLINSVLDTRDKAILALLAKTGVRRGELIAMDVDDIDWTEQSITLKHGKFKKRSSRVVFFDDEMARLLKRWIVQRDRLSLQTRALFVGEHNRRLVRNGIYSLTVKHALNVGLHDPTSARTEDHFSPHCFRHWFTTHLRRAGMNREFIKALRGDRRREAIDIYDRIDREELRRAYLAYIPQLGLG